MTIEHQEGWLSGSSSTWEVRGLSPNLSSPSWSTRDRKKSPMTSVWENQQGYHSPGWDGRSAENLGTLLKGPHTGSLALKDSLWALAEGWRNIGRSWVVWLQGYRAAETTSTVSVLHPPLTQPVGEHHLSYVKPSLNTDKSESALNWVNSPTRPNLETPWDPTSPKSSAVQIFEWLRLTASWQVTTGPAQAATNCRALTRYCLASHKQQLTLNYTRTPPKRL